MTSLLLSGLLAAAPIAGLFASIAAAPSARAQRAPQIAEKRPIYTTALEAHSLTSEEAARAYPVHLRGVVTCYDPSTVPGHAAMFIHDETGSIYVMLADRLNYAFPIGTLVDVHGVTDAGTAAPIIEHTQVVAIGPSHVPKDAPLEDLFHLETGTADAKWVQVEGTIHSVLEHEHYVSLQLAMLGGSVGVVMRREQGADYQHLVDAKVRIRGNAAPMFNRNDQIIGARILAADLSALTVLEAAPGDPFQQPFTKIDNLLRWDQISSARHRVHLRGEVTLQWPGSLLCLRDATRAICAKTVQAEPVAVGDMAEIIGFSEAVNGTPMVVDAVYRDVGRGGAVIAKAVSAEQALIGKDDSGLIEVDGKLIGADLASSDNTLLLTSGNTIFTAILPKEMAGSAAGKWQIGSRLRITGICSVQLETQQSAVGRGIAVAKSFRVLMRSPADVVVLQRPSWWTVTHTIVSLSLLVVVVLGALGWITGLRRRLYRQTIALEKAREESAAIDELASAMQEVSSNRMLTARVSATGSEQIAQLGTGFNRMLSELEENDRAKRQAEAKLLQQALTDELTGLPNRRAMAERLEQSLASAKRKGGILAVLFIDLDGFKAVNDTLGHAAGDLLLIEVTRRLKSRIRQADTLARLGGDEFTVVLTTLRSQDEAAIVGDSLIQVLAAKFLIEGSEVTIGASIGISMFPQDAEDAEALLQEADSAMYMAKGTGKNRVHHYTPELGFTVRERLSLESQLRGAIARGEMHIHYQPEFNLKSHRLTRFEALCRWDHPILGAISPAKFIPVAEQTGLIVAIGAYVLQEACREAAKWQAISGHPIQVAVNVSSLQFSRPTFLDDVEAILRETGLDPALLQIELAESIMLIGVERVLESMNRLRALGVSLAIDDFGTGYSCLSYLSMLPFDTLKIDRSFVQTLQPGSGTEAIVSFLIMLAHHLKMEVVVEGIETAEQLEIVIRLNGNEVQGFLTGRPNGNPQALLQERRDPATFPLNWITEAA